MAEGFCSTKITFVRTTLVVLHDQLKKYILAYVDNTIVKRKKIEDRIKDLKETSFNFHIASLKLNLEKCIFRVQK